MLVWSSGRPVSTSLRRPPYVCMSQQAKALEEARRDAGLTFQQLVDYAFSSRVVFFNAQDKQQVLPCMYVGGTSSTPHVPIHTKHRSATGGGPGRAAPQPPRPE